MGQMITKLYACNSLIKHVQDEARQNMSRKRNQRFQLQGANIPTIHQGHNNVTFSWESWLAMEGITIMTRFCECVAAVGLYLVPTYLVGSYDIFFFNACWRYKRPLYSSVHKHTTFTWSCCRSSFWSTEEWACFASASWPESVWFWKSCGTTKNTRHNEIM